MAYRLSHTFPDQTPKRRPEKRSDYLSWLHTLPCCVTGRNDVEAAHLSSANPWYGHYGRGRGTKAPDRFALPLSKAEHNKQHSMGEAEYWASTGINPHELAVTLFGIHADYDGFEATQRAEARIRAGLAVVNRLPNEDLP